MKIEFDTIPDQVITDLCKRFEIDINKDDHVEKLKKKFEENECSLYWVVNEYLEWHGIIGYTWFIWNIIEPHLKEEKKDKDPFKCVICGINIVAADQGCDTCRECLKKI